MDRDIEEYVLPLGPAELDAVEISGALHAGRGWRTFTELSFPEFDICKAETLPGRQFDVVICEQVLEHVVDPTTAMRNLAGLCRSSGHVVVGTPFLVRVHGHPGDYWRWTPDGLRLLIENSGLKVEEVRSWGNRRCIRANFYVWAGYRPWHSLRNETDLPMHVVVCQEAFVMMWVDPGAGCAPAGDRSGQ
jgi:SAM-dependent methyltransferase